MPISAGTRLGLYEVIAPLGAGGMGEVYRARDTKLDRDVALKVLLEELFEDRDRVARFEREAKALASLNHPGIAAVHSFEAVDGRHILVMELVEGEGLDARIARGAIPLEEALPIARQIAEALEAAHEKGIVHRDLKPANVMISHDGRVKLLDFGLAKAFELDPASSSAPQVTHSPTLTARATAAGVILGTAAYMSPEQARGRPVDRRADIWAFGCVLFEMLTGRRVFDGETASDMLAAVLRQDIDFAALPPGTPPSIARLLRRCLERDPKKRLHDAGDARLEIDDAIASPAERPPSSALARTADSRAVRWIPWLLAAALAIIAVFALRRPAPASREVVHLSIGLPESVGLDADFLTQSQLLAISPDGRRIAFRGRSGDSGRIYLRDLSREIAEPVPGTEGGNDPFFSPDGEWLGFVAGDKLKKTSLHGGTPAVLAAATQVRGCAWGDDGTIVFSPTVNMPLFRIPAAGGEPRPVTTLDAAGRERTHRWPEILPGGKMVLFTVGTEDKPGDYDEARIDAVSIATGKRHVVFRGASFARYAPPGHLLLARHGDLLAVPFDVETAEVRGNPVPILQAVSGDARSGVAYFGVAKNGALVYAAGIASLDVNEIVWIDRAGRREPTGIPPGVYSQISLSPDGQKLAYAEGPAGGGRSDIRIADLAHGGQFQLTSNGKAASPRWTPDGARIVYSTPENAIMRQNADGSGAAEALWQAKRRVPISLESFTPDGSALIFSLAGLPTRNDIFLLPLSGPREARELIATPDSELFGKVSPDGRWIAYAGQYEGGPQIYVQPFPGLTGRWQISRGGGSSPLWSRDGKEIFFIAGDQLFSTPVKSAPAFSPGEPHALLRIDRPSASASESHDIYDVTPDGKRFIVLVQQKDSTKGRIDVILNFGKRLATGAP
jgi:serine/threonine protein kinase/Tol biopolymer transport system component